MAGFWENVYMQFERSSVYIERRSINTDFKAIYNVVLDNSVIDDLQERLIRTKKKSLLFIQIQILHL